MAATPLIEFCNIGHSYDDGRIVALRGIDAKFAKGRSFAIVGPSGSGKTTLMQLMCGIRTPSHGEVLWQGRCIDTPKAWTALRGSGIGIVFQEFNLFPTLTAAENVEMALLGGSLSKSEREQAVLRALADVGLSKRADHQPHELSGGERQRVAVARSIVNAPSLLLADEPTGNLDSANSDAIIKLLFDLKKKKGMTLVIVTHDPGIAKRCEEVIEIRDGRIKGQKKKAKRK
jgi:ABC-type lipoprotein export system ATPase subunit